MTARDAAAEAVAGIVQRPGRAGADHARHGPRRGCVRRRARPDRHGAGQISHQFTVLADTTVTVEDNGPANNVAPPGTNPAIGFPADADAIAGHIDGVAAAGVWWPVSFPDGTNFTGSLALSATAVPDGQPAGRLAGRGAGDGPDHGRGLAAEQRTRTTPASTSR